MAEDILDMPLPDTNHRTYGKVLGLKQSVMASVLTATARTRDTLLRPVNDEGLEGLLALVNAESGDVPSEQDLLDRLFT